jgi:glutamine synthetase
MATTGVLPAALSYQTNVGAAATITKGDALSGYSTTVSTLSNELITRIGVLKKKIGEVDQFNEHHLHEKAAFLRGEVTDAMIKTREICDELEGVVDNKLWPFPKYSEILFMK